MSHIFVSYSQSDGDFAENLITRLQRAGFETWRDKDRLRAGSDWSDGIDRGIREASAVVLIVSPDSRASEYVTYEWSYALGAGIHVVPILKGKTEIHPRLARLQYLDFSGDVRPWDALMDELKSFESQKHLVWKPPQGTPQHIQRAVADLDSGNSQDRTGAIKVLSQSDHEVARFALRRAISHPFRDVRALAALALGELRDDVINSSEGMSALTDALAYQSEESDDRSREMRAWAGDTLARIGRPALRTLIQASSSPNDLAQSSSFELLARVGGRDAVPVLIEGIGSHDYERAKLAVKQLGELHAVEAVQPILQVMVDGKGNKKDKGSDSIRLDAVVALIDIGDKSIKDQLIELTKHKLAFVRMCAAQVLGELCGEEAIPILSGLLADEAKEYYMYFSGSGGCGGRWRVSDVAAIALDHVGTSPTSALLLDYRKRRPRGEGPGGPPWLSVDD